MASALAPRESALDGDSSHSTSLARIPTSPAERVEVRSMSFGIGRCGNPLSCRGFFVELAGVQPIRCHPRADRSTFGRVQFRGGNECLESQAVLLSFLPQRFNLSLAEHCRASPSIGLRTLWLRGIRSLLRLEIDHRRPRCVHGLGSRVHG